MAHEYVEEREGGFYVTGSRVSLASIIYAFRDGASLESIRDDFPTLSLAQVYGAIAFYLNHQQESEDYLAALGETWRRLEREGQLHRRNSKRESKQRGNVCSLTIDDSASSCGC